jgi:hypothetical protein
MDGERRQVFPRYREITNIHPLGTLSIEGVPSFYLYPYEKQNQKSRYRGSDTLGCLSVSQTPFN